MPGSWHHPLLPSWLWQWAVVRQATRMAIRINLCNALGRMHDDTLWGGGGRGWRGPDHGADFLTCKGRWTDAHNCRGAACPVSRPIACAFDVVEVGIGDARQQVGVRLRDVCTSLPLASSMHSLQSDLVGC